MRPTWPKASENAERQIQINYYKKLTHEITHVRYQIKAYTCCESSQHVRFQKGFSAKANNAII
jgi:hypothetical protein